MHNKRAEKPTNTNKQSESVKSAKKMDGTRVRKESPNTNHGNEEMEAEAAPSTDDSNNESDGEWIPDEFPVEDGDDESLNDVENIIEVEFHNGSRGGHHPEGINVSDTEGEDSGKTEATAPTSDADDNASPHRILAGKPTPSEIQLTNGRGGVGRTVQVAFARRSPNDPLFSFYILDKDR